MVKKGEYIEFAQSLYEKMEDMNPLDMKEDGFYPTTEMSIILELTNKVKELEAKINEMDLKIKALEKKQEMYYGSRHRKRYSKSD